jgi:hypothetical protein
MWQTRKLSKTEEARVAWEWAQGKQVTPPYIYIPLKGWHEVIETSSGDTTGPSQFNSGQMTSIGDTGA